MKTILFILMFSGLAWTQQPSAEQNLQKAYQKEYTFLVSQKRVLEQQLKDFRQRKDQQLGALKNEIQVLEKQWIKTSLKSKRVQNELVEMERNIDTVGFDQERLINMIRQASHRMAPLDSSFKDIDQKENKLESISNIFQRAPLVLKSLTTPRTRSGQFFDQSGKKHEGELTFLGNIAGFAKSNSVTGPIAPVKGGQFQLLENYDFGDLESARMVPFFLVESMSSEYVPAKEKTIMDEIQAGGTIGLVIIGLGLFSLVLVVRRYFLLRSAGQSFESTTREAILLIQNGDSEKAVSLASQQKSAFGRVMADAISSIDKPRELIEEVVNESLLRESRHLTRFATMVMITAAVAPLLGLLGTVTGMIATFDVITEFGTGDPKMLSGGVSEALVTTKMGLVVAIPAVLAGNLLSNWSSRIRSKIQQSVLSVVNAIKG